ncbi:MAG TPA: flagellin [Candidatus Sulfotelmatobacter sp.]|nr:flagellin [Candidatus Sulfotelmatobacter sp.]
MPIGILNNIASLSAENQLSITNNSLQSTLYQLSSGSRINSGADDAAGLAIANGLQANITALTQSARNANDGVGELQVADGALAQVTTLLNRAVTLATESSTGTVSDSQRLALQSEFSQIQAEISRIGTNTTYNGAQVFTSSGTDYNQAYLTSGTLTNTSAVSGTLAIKDTAGATLYTTSASDTTVGAVINDINNSNTGLIATLNANGQLMITDTQNRSTGAASELTTDYTTGTFKLAGAAPTATTNTTGSNTMNVYLSDSTTAGSSQIGVTLNSLSAGNINGISLTGDNLSTQATAQTALTDINNAIAGVAALRGQIGAAVNRLQSASNVINNQVQNLTSAENGITAADIPSAVANLTKYSILEQTGISSLAQANQQQQLVLKLLQ